MEKLKDVIKKELKMVNYRYDKGMLDNIRF